MQSLTSIQGNTVAGQGMAAAASLIMFVPNLILFIFLQGKVMNTMAHSGIQMMKKDIDFTFHQFIFADAIPHSKC